MPPLKRLTGAAIRAVIDRQGSGASYATLARATGHSRAEVQKLCEAQGIFLRVSSTQGGTPAAEDRSAELGPPALVGRVKDIIWDPHSGKLPPIPRREYDGLVAEWYGTNRALGDRTPFDVAFRHHREHPQLESEFARAREELEQLRASGPFRRGRDEGFRKGYSDGYARARSEFSSKVQLPCALCGRPLLVDFGEHGKAKTPARALLDGYLGRRPPGPRSIVHVDCDDPGRGEGVIDESPENPNRWSLILADGKTIPTEGSAWSQRVERYRSGTPTGRT